MPARNPDEMDEMGEKAMESEEEKTCNRLIEKSTEAFVLAIELYNRPSIKYRVEGFAFFVCNAWELMLKAKMIRDSGIDSIYYKGKSGRRTKSLEACIKTVFTNKHDPLRSNLEKIVSLRDTGTHFVVPEYEQIYVGLFQACVRNFDEKMYEFHGRNVSDVIPPHFLTLSMSASPATPEEIRAKYPPDVAEKFLFDSQQVFREECEMESPRFAVVVRTEVAVVKNRKNADFTVAYDTTSEKGIRTAKVFQDPHTTHPLSASNVIDYVRKRLDRESITLMARGEAKNFTQSDWNLFCKFYGFKNDREFGYCHQVNTTKNYTYSMKVVDFIVDRIRENPSGIIDGLKKEVLGKE